MPATLLGCLTIHLLASFQMEFKKDMSKMISARFSITSITFHINTSYSVVKDVLSLSSPYVEPSTHVHLVRSFPVVSVLSRLGISLAQSEVGSSQSFSFHKLPERLLQVSCSVTLPHEDGVLTEGAISLLHETKRHVFHVLMDWYSHPGTAL